ncbi:MAG: hypothetical protein U0V74_05980 [Chitinophagales bacterium]
MLAVIRVHIKNIKPFPNSPGPVPMLSDQETRDAMDENIPFSLGHFCKLNTFGTHLPKPFTIFPVIEINDPGGNYFRNKDLVDLIIREVTGAHLPDWKIFTGIIVLIDYFNSNDDTGGFTGGADVPEIIFPFWYLVFLFRKKIPISICPIVKKPNREFPSQAIYHEYLHSIGYGHVFGLNGQEANLYGFCRMSSSLVSLSAAHFYSANMLNFKKPPIGSTSGLNPLNVLGLLIQQRILEFSCPDHKVCMQLRLTALDEAQTAHDWAQQVFLLVIHGKQTYGKRFFIELRRKNKASYDEQIPHDLSLVIHSFDPSKNAYANFIFEGEMEISAGKHQYTQKDWPFEITVLRIPADHKFVELKVCGK